MDPLKNQITDELSKMQKRFEDVFARETAAMKLALEQKFAEEKAVLEQKFAQERAALLEFAKCQKCKQLVFSNMTYICKNCLDRV